MELTNERGQGDQPHEQLRNGRVSLTFSVNAPLGGGGLSLGATELASFRKAPHACTTNGLTRQRGCESH